MTDNPVTLELVEALREHDEPFEALVETYSRADGNAKLVLLVLLLEADHRGSCEMSIHDLADSSASWGATTRHLRTLERLGEIVIERRRGKRHRYWITLMHERFN